MNQGWIENLSFGEGQSMSSLAQHSFQIGENLLAQRTQKQRKRSGQFLTPAKVARFMADRLGPLQSGDRILDPAIGSGTLVCAVIDRIINEGQPIELWVEGYETDAELCQSARQMLAYASDVAASHGISIHAQVHQSDFIVNSTSLVQAKLPFTEPYDSAHTRSCFTHIIANPPYFKLNKADPRAEAAAGKVQGHTNIYTLFLALSVHRLLPEGRACFIVPRSFCSGAYFSAFRKEFLAQAIPVHIHLFESRERLFSSSAVLQENVIFAFRKRLSGADQEDNPAYIEISTSSDDSVLDKRVAGRQVAMNHFLGERLGSFFFRIPTSELDEKILETVDNWPGSLAQYNVEISTGPVVAFRAKEFLTDTESVKRGQSVPLLWMQNVNPWEIIWPVSDGNKPQGISIESEDAGLLVPVANYVLIRRFSAKEEPRRLIAAPLLSGEYDHHQWIGLENHLNYVYRRNGDLIPEEVLGLSALFNSALIDRYFRIINGNTQVNATEVRALPLPPIDVIQEIGSRIQKNQQSSLSETNEIVFRTLYKHSHLDKDFPILKESRLSMDKIREAQDVLEILGMPPAQQNEISALTLLVLAQLSEDTPWSAAQTQCMRIHDILGEIDSRYGRKYAENTRETVRRQVLHQFVQAGLAVPNPDKPDRATNSPNFCYALTDLALRTIKAYSSDRWTDAVRAFQEDQDALVEIYRQSRAQVQVPLLLKDGQAVYLSPGRHNELQVAIVEEFGPRFVPGGTLIYLGDTANKTAVLEEAVFEELGAPVPSREKLPDVIIYDRKRHWLFLVEAVTSHGPVSPKRHFELEEVLGECSAGRVYVTAFPDFSTLKDFLTEIAWETEVWIAEMPDHLIHYDGERFLGIHNQ